jgi:hypothetical protein
MGAFRLRLIDVMENRTIMSLSQTSCLSNMIASCQSLPHDLRLKFFTWLLSNGLKVPRKALWSRCSQFMRCIKNSVSTDRVFDYCGAESQVTRTLPK